MYGEFPGTWSTWQWLRLSTIYCCALRPWSPTGVIYQSCWFLDFIVFSCCARTGCLEPVGWMHVCEIDLGHFTNSNLSDCCEMLVYRDSTARLKFYVCSLYRILDLNDRISECLLTSMAAVQAEDVCSSYLFMGDLNDWPSSAMVGFYRHGVCGSRLSNCRELSLWLAQLIHAEELLTSWWLMFLT